MVKLSLCLGYNSKFLLQNIKKYGGGVGGSLVLRLYAEEKYTEIFQFLYIRITYLLNCLSRIIQGNGRKMFCE